MNRSNREWAVLARKRLTSILDRHGIAQMRTLEQKISDAGPADQRIDPHVLSKALKEMVNENRILKTECEGAPWYHLKGTPKAVWQERLDVQLPVYKDLHVRNLGMRIGQCLEIAVFKALCSKWKSGDFFGDFPELNAHDDSRLYRKEEPPQALSGRRLQGKKQLDFLIRHPKAGWAGVEAKNVRQWLYPDRDQIRDLLAKATAIDSVPVLIARRIPFVTFKVLNPCGVVVHQTYNQLLPETDRELADKARDKMLMGYHDIRTGNQPDSRMLKFIGKDLPSVLPEAREKFDEYKDLVSDFANQRISYEEFAARVRRRSQDSNEDSDWDWDQG